jgi:uncharacterized protein (TIGR03083 family)
MVGRSSLTLEVAHLYGLELVQRHSARFVDYVTSLDEQALDQPVPGLDWTVGETIAHVQSVYLRYTVDLRRAETPDEVANLNADDIARLGVDVVTATRTIAEQVAAMASLAPHIEPQQIFPFHAGARTTLAGGWGNLLGELLAHGDDIARSTGEPFGIPGDDLEVLWRFTAPVLQGWLRAGATDVRDSWELRFPFGSIGVVFDRGQLGWDDELIDDPDHVIHIDDAAEWTLAFPYRRRPMPDELTARLAERFQSI